MFADSWASKGMHWGADCKDMRVCGIWDWVLRCQNLVSFDLLFSFAAWFSTKNSTFNVPTFDGHLRHLRRKRQPGRLFLLLPFSDTLQSKELKEFLPCLSDVVTSSCPQMAVLTKERTTMQKADWIFLFGEFCFWRGWGGPPCWLWTWPTFFPRMGVLCNLAVFLCHACFFSGEANVYRFFVSPEVGRESWGL